MMRAKRLEAKIDLYLGDFSAASTAATILAAANPADTNTKALQAVIADAEAAKTRAASH